MNGTGRCVVGLVWVLSAAPAWGQTVTVRVATFNIEHFNSSNSQQLNAARDILIRVGADVVCVQEMSSSVDFFILAGAAGYAFGVIAGTSGDVDTNDNDIAAVMSKHPFVNTSTHTSASLSGDGSARDLTRNFILATVDIPNVVGHLIITGNHWKAGNGDANEFRRSIESIRSLQVVAGLDSAVDAYLIVGDQNDDVSDSPDSPAQFNSLPSGLPVSFSLGNDISFPVANGVFLPLFGAGGSAHVNIVTALQLFSQSGEPLDSTRPASGRRLDYIWHSDALTLTGQEVYDSRDEGLGGGGLPKFGAPLPFATSADASDHLLVFAEYTMSAPSGDGACCHSGDLCVDDVDRLGCDARSGLFHGPGSTCAGPLDPACEPAGACCQPGGNCVDDLGAGGCVGVGGFYYGDGTTCAGPLDPVCESETTEAVINEVLASHDGTDDMEFIELFGPPLGVLDGLSVVIIEGQTASKGLIDRIIDLTGQQIGSDGYFVM